jgi:hypothetical protein
MKIRPVGAEMLHSDGRTDMAKLIVAFRNPANAPENYFTLSAEMKVMPIDESLHKQGTFPGAKQPALTVS